MEKVLYDLTNPQKSIWYTEQFYQNSSINNIVGYLKIEKNTNFAALEKAFNLFIMNNDSFKLKFIIQNNEPKQYFSDFIYEKIEIIDLEDFSQLEEFEKSFPKKPFSLNDNLLFNPVILRFPNTAGILVLSTHHLISDAWTMSLTLNEIYDNYIKLTSNQDFVDEKKPSYLDFIKSNSDYLSSEKFKKDKEYWSETFKTLPNIVSFKNTEHSSSISSSRKVFNFNDSLIAKIDTFCVQNNISIYIFLLAIYGIYFRNIFNTPNFVIGNPVLNRSNFKEKHTTGMFVSIMPFLFNITDSNSFVKFTEDLAVNQKKMYRHLKYPYHEILNQIHTDHNFTGNLYDIVFSYQNANIPSFCKWLPNYSQAESLQIHIKNLNEGKKALSVHYDYLTDIFSEEDINKMHARISNMISQVLENNSLLISDFEITSNSERNFLIKDFNATKMNYPNSSNIVKEFEKVVKKYPNNVAVSSNTETLTYEELNHKANVLAKQILDSNIETDIIAFSLKRNVSIYIAILGILKSGHTYMPIDPDYPIDRINFMLENSNTKILISANDFVNNIKFDGKLIDVNLINFNTEEKNLDIPIDSNKIAYIMYTSGSTGIPKAVAIKHYNVLNFANSMFKKLNYNPEYKQTVLSVTTVCFDIFVFETFPTLLSGLQIFIADELQAKSPKLLSKVITEQKISKILTTPSRVELLFDNEKYASCLANVEEIILGGEPFPEILLNKLKHITKARLLNLYGPTETTVYSAFKDLTDCTDITIGKPIDNTQIYILNDNNKILPIGISGEICIGGDGVGAGYYKNPEKTNLNFIQNPYSKGIIYKTGDLVKWLPDGNIEFLGRIDSQVKIRGFRIELNEINLKILSFPDVKECYTNIYEVNTQKHICSYVVFKNNTSERILKDFLLKNLPLYMIPSCIMIMDKLPLNANGKIDKNNLPFPEHFSRNIIAPRNSIETFLVDSIRNIINSDSISIDDNILEIGIDSLSAITLAASLAKKYNIQITVKEILEIGTIKDLAKLIANADKVINATISKAEKSDFYPLSSAQKRIYYACKMIGDENVVYNVSGKAEFNQHLDSNKVKKIFNRIIDRHVSFRTAFVIDNNEVKQKIINNIKLDIPVFNSTEAQMSNNISKFVRPFNLETAPLLRVELHYLENGKTVLLIDTHHIIMDGTSLKNLINDFNDLYNNNTLPEKSITYIDYSVWEQQNLESEKMQESEKYWVEKINNFPLQALNLPFDYNPKAIKTFAGNKISQKIDDIEFSELEDTAKLLGISPYILFISAFIVLLHKYTNQNEIVIGSPIVNREHSELQNLIGMFVNNITITSIVNSNMTFSDFTHEVKEQIFEDINNQEYPYDMLVKKLNIPNNSSLFDVVFTYQNTENVSIKINNEVAALQEIKNNISKFYITLEVQPNSHTINLEYMTDLFKLETMKSFMEHYIFILHQLKENINVNIKDINIITPDEEKMLNTFNDTFEPVNNDTAISLFEEQVRMNPDNIALICNDEKLTYAQLNAKANSLAHYLLKKGIKPNDIVCIMANRSLETIICMLGILKSGAAFLNLDPTYPVDRTKYYINDSNVQYVLVQKELSEKVESIKNCIYIDLDSDFYNYNFENPNISVKDTDLSYLIYTSGSTGMPKGVMLNQVGLANMAKAMTKVLDYLKEGNKHTIVSVTSTPFDIFVYEIIVSLTHGLKVVMANNAEHRNPKLLDALIRKYHVDVMTVTPSLMKINYDNREPNTALAMVKNMVFGGEPLPEKFVKDLKALADDITVYNIYGPSEITILSNVQNLNGEKEITVGPPIMNTQIHILDKNMNRVPIGVVGEIYISGIQVGLGYMGKPDMTSAKFLDNPFGSGKIYKSGDIGRWTFDGKVQCLGRIDNQIKLRGLRIELGEIENRILEIEGISSAIVNKIELDGKEVLCGYYVSNVDIKESYIKDILRKNLPPYMIPSYILRLDKMPYTINRKIDRKALPIPQANHIDENSKINIATLNSNEDKLIQIWKNILKVDNITIDDNFFDIGGDSVSAITMQLEAIKYDLDFEYADIFNYPTIRQLAKKLPSPEKSFMDNYDYDTINKVLSRNTFENISKIKKYDVKNVLLIGGTGYLGSHIIDSFMKNESGTIYCLIREKNNQKPIARLRSILHFYFGDKYDNEINNRIKILEGDIVKQNLGLSEEDYAIIKNDIDVIINSGAIVKHYGLKQQFEDINVVGTQHVVDLCKKEKKRLLHVSTMSVSGFGEKENSSDLLDLNKIDFCEQNLFVGQSIKGIYTSTKYKAEVLILEAISKGLDAQILRIGNITNRYSDGVFQKNIENNAFANRIKSFVDMGAFPEYALEHEIELTPVDLCADCIIKILEHSSKCNMFHLYNPNLLSVKLLYDVLKKEFDINLVPLSNRLLSYLITGILQDEKNKKILSGIIYDLDNDKNLIYTSKIRLNADFTNSYLNEIGFHWKKIDEDYIVKYMNYFKKIKFINLDKE